MREHHNKSQHFKTFHNKPRALAAEQPETHGKNPPNPITHSLMLSALA